MDALTSESYPACGFSIRYDYGIFKQRIVDGWQIEMPDDWLDKGDVWLAPRPEETFEINFGGHVDEDWQSGKLKIKQSGYTTILALAYDMHISGFNTKAVNRIRLWAAKAPVDFDMALFSRGEYLKASENKALAESISKVLYPADNHIEGKSLRLKQQYFFVSASIQSILKNHLKFNQDFDNLADEIAIHINDTHPTLCIPELMRILIDIYEYDWEKAWSIVKNTVSYTNHTVMAEALEKWPQHLIESHIPRIYQIISELNRRYCAELWSAFPNDWERVAKNAIMGYGEIRMANICLYASHTVNGVSALHSEILKHDVFADAYKMAPKKFTNVTNGITHRRWLCEANPELSDYIKTLIGKDFETTANITPLLKYQGDKEVLNNLEKIKRNNKIKLAKYIKDNNDIDLPVDSIFDVQVKRLHEYKRQLLNAIHILDLYLKLKDNPDLDIVPRSFIFGAKAASSYYIAKLIIRLIYMMSKTINNDVAIKDKLKVVFLENYRVTLAEVIMPASEVSEQISIAGKEASGTGNMKFMINGAITVGTMDGANVEIHENVGDENIFIFGLRAEEVVNIQREGKYAPTSYYHNDTDLRRVIDYMRAGIGGVSFAELADLLTIGRNGAADPYMVLADFRSYANAQSEIDKAYRDRERWNRMSLMNIAGAGIFSADRAINDYAKNIWHTDKVI
ncbi:MAG: glycogen/starch/alpha-glucan family phosphorylase, partial [Clostridia bacterium]|nr:glycogen/starch/alpha-glucan family phosphorylase [Clostridia bacterium]